MRAKVIIAKPAELEGVLNEFLSAGNVQEILEIVPVDHIYGSSVLMIIFYR